MIPWSGNYLYCDGTFKIGNTIVVVPFLMYTWKSVIYNFKKVYMAQVMPFSRETKIFTVILTAGLWIFDEIKMEQKSQTSRRFLPLVTLFHCLLVLSSPTATRVYLYRNTLLSESVHQAVFVLTHKCRPLSTFPSPNLSSWQMAK